MRPSRIAGGPNPMTGSFLETEKKTDMQRVMGQRLGFCRQKQGRPRVARSPQNWEGVWDNVSQSFHRELTPLIPRCRAPGLQSCERLSFCGLLHGSPRKP